jgi:HlyD family secretion protein
VLVEADAASLKAVGELKLSAGMPAQVYLEGSRQTALDYLVEPLASGIRKAGRQL